MRLSRVCQQQIGLSAPTFTEHVVHQLDRSLLLFPSARTPAVHRLVVRLLRLVWAKDLTEAEGALKALEDIEVRRVQNYVSLEIPLRADLAVDVAFALEQATRPCKLQLVFSIHVW